MRWGRRLDEAVHHMTLDRAVDKLYRRAPFTSNSSAWSISSRCITTCEHRWCLSCGTREGRRDTLTEQSLRDAASDIFGVML